MTTLKIWPGMSFGDFLCQEVSDEGWNLMDPPPVAEPQDFIRPRCYAPKYLLCEGCQTGQGSLTRTDEQPRPFVAAVGPSNQESKGDRP